MKVIDRTKTGTLHFLDNSLKTIKEHLKNPKHTEIVFSKCLLRHGFLRVFLFFYVLAFVRAILLWWP